MDYKALVESACGILQEEYGNAGSLRVDEYDWSVDADCSEKCCNLDLGVEDLSFDLRFNLDGCHLLSQEAPTDDVDRFMAYCLVSLFIQSIGEAAGVQTHSSELYRNCINESPTASSVCFDIDLSAVVRLAGSGEEIGR